uniref:Uncharacterized protein n=1 Tax=Globodera rostochiensis TaxID=31243 RepID=A0A914HNN0_GLORO
MSTSDKGPITETHYGKRSKDPMDKRSPPTDKMSTSDKCPRTETHYGKRSKDPMDKTSSSHGQNVNLGQMSQNGNPLRKTFKRSHGQKVSSHGQNVNLGQMSQNGNPLRKTFKSRKVLALGTFVVKLQLQLGNLEDGRVIHKFCHTLDDNGTANWKMTVKHLFHSPQNDTCCAAVQPQWL